MPTDEAAPGRGRRSCKVAIIGAGAAGLAAARELRAEGHNIAVYEQGLRLGGVWVYSDAVDSDPLGADPRRARVHSSLYSGLRTNLPRQIMQFGGFPNSPAAMGPKYSADARMFPGHQEILNYLDAFAERYDLHRLVRYNTRVTRVTPVEARQGGGEGEGGGWRGRNWVVEAQPAGAGGGGGEGPRGGGGEGAAGVSSEAYDAVLIATGHFSEPHLPDVPGSAAFPGRQLHSHSYRRPEHYAGQAVAVVGASFSALDISKHVAAAAARVYVCARQWDSRRALGAPYGPRSNIERRGMITKLTPEGGAVFASGPAAPRVDAVIYCTGYEYWLPFLDLGALGLSTGQQRVAPLYQHMFAPAYGPGLAFIGLPFRAVSFPLFELQAKLCARLLSGRASLPLPEAMAAWVAGSEARRKYEGRPPAATHRFDHRQMAHHAWLARACGPGVSSVPDLPAAALHVYWVAAWAAHALALGWRDLRLWLCARRKGA